MVTSTLGSGVIYLDIVINDLDFSTIIESIQYHVPFGLANNRLSQIEKS